MGQESRRSTGNARSKGILRLAGLFPLYAPKSPNHIPSVCNLHRIPHTAQTTLTHKSRTLSQNPTDMDILRSLHIHARQTQHRSPMHCYHGDVAHKTLQSSDWISRKCKQRWRMMRHKRAANPCPTCMLREKISSSHRYACCLNMFDDCADVPARVCTVTPLASDPQRQFSSSVLTLSGASSVSAHKTLV